VGQVLIICGSARGDGDTADAVEKLSAAIELPTRSVDLCDHVVAPFDYHRPAQLDHFDMVIAALLAHRSVVFATPVYWYAMSAQLKALFDRFSDLLSDRDPACRGRALAGRHVWLLAIGTDPEMPPGLETPFERTADYLGMRWKGACYLRRGSDGAEPKLRHFARLIESAAMA